MIERIDSLSELVERCDRATTVRSFVAVFAPLLVLWNLALLAQATAMLGEMELDDLLDEPIDFIAAGSLVVLAFVLATAPLWFLFVDWLRRQRAGRDLAFATGLLLGLVALGAIGAVFGMVALELDDAIDGVLTASGKFSADLALVTPIAIMLVGYWMVAARRPRWRWIGVAFVLAMAALAAMPFLVTDEPMQSGSETYEWLAQVALATIAVVTIARAISLRYALSAAWQRDLLFGSFVRRSFWTRMAQVAGLPSSLWHARELWRLPTACLLAARPIVYVGAALILARGEDEELVSMRGGIGLLLVLAGHALFAVGKRLAARRIWRPDDRSDHRAPILFLRSFGDDQMAIRPRWWNLLARWFGLWSFRRNVDEMLVDEMEQYGPVVALGKVDERGLPFGAMRHYSTHDDWQRVVTETAVRAQAIVIVAGDSPGVIWEFDLLRQRDLVAKTLLVFRPGKENAATNRTALERFPLTQPAPSPDAGAMVALVPESGAARLLTSQSPRACDYLVALRRHFQDRAPASAAGREPVQGSPVRDQHLAEA